MILKFKQKIAKKAAKHPSGDQTAHCGEEARFEAVLSRKLLAVQNKPLPLELLSSCRASLLLLKVASRRGAHCSSVRERLTLAPTAWCPRPRGHLPAGGLGELPGHTHFRAGQEDQVEGLVGTGSSKDSRRGINNSSGS